MHIAYVTADRGVPVFGSKGASIHVREMVKAFNALGHEVTIFTSRRGPETAIVPAEIIKVVAPVKISESSEGELQRTRSRELQALENSDAIDKALISFNASKPIDFIYERYSLFGSAGLSASQKLGIPLALEVNVPLILEQQKYRKIYHEQRAMALEKRLFSQADALFAVSSQVRDYALGKGARQGFAHILPNAVDCEMFHPSIAPISISENNRFTIGFVGSLKPWHGIDNLLHAFRDFVQREPESHLVIVGDGPLKPWIEGFIRGAAIDSNVSITGWTEHIQLPGLLTAMDVAVAPYPDIEDFYFSPLKLYEYMAAGTPVIASRIGQICDVIKHGDNGLLVSAGNHHELSSAIATIKQDKPTSTRLANNARKLVTQRTWQHNAIEVINHISAQPAQRAVAL